jgi:hypothetical protein
MSRRFKLGTKTLYLFIYCLFNETISSCSYIALNRKVISELGGMQKEALVA